jgi:hypothetical protein
MAVNVKIERFHPTLFDVFSYFLEVQLGLVFYFSSLSLLLSAVFCLLVVFEARRDRL